jgi:hypothetical protein
VLIKAFSQGSLYPLHACKTIPEIWDGFDSMQTVCLQQTNEFHRSGGKKTRISKMLGEENKALMQQLGAIPAQK